MNKSIKKREGLFVVTKNIYTVNRAAKVIERKQGIRTMGLEREGSQFNRESQYWQMNLIDPIIISTSTAYLAAMFSTKCFTIRRPSVTTKSLANGRTTKPPNQY